jgi:hypothetical protein
MKAFKGQSVLIKMKNSIEITANCFEFLWNSSFNEIRTCKAQKFCFIPSILLWVLIKKKNEHKISK